MIQAFLGVKPTINLSAFITDSADIIGVVSDTAYVEKTRGGGRARMQKEEQEKRSA